MFTSPPQRHPLQSFPFWFLILSGVALLAAWKLQLLSGPGSDAFVPVADTEPDNPPGSHTAASAAAVTIPFAEQGSVGEATASEWAEQPETPMPPPQTASTVRLVSGSDADSAPFAWANLASDSNSEGVKVAMAEKSEAVAPSQSDPPARSDLSTELAEAARLREVGDDVAAHRILSTLYWQHPDARDQFQEAIDALARKIYFEAQPNYLAPHVVQQGETLQQIGRRYQVPWEYLAKLNGVDPKNLRPGESLKILQGPFHAVVELSRFEITVHAYGYYVARYPIGIGQDGATPIGRFQVTEKLVDPTYYGSDGVIEHDDPANPLGERWLAINDEAGTATGYGIHGTIDPASIGQAESKGCIRLRNDNVEALYDLLIIGSEVVIRP